MTDYNHTQSVANTSWVINHGMDTDGVVIDTMVDNAGTIEKVLPTSAVQTDKNTVTLTFPTALVGFARLIASTGQSVFTNIVVPDWTITDITGLTYGSVSFEAQLPSGTPNGIVFNEDGTKVYIMINGVNTVYQYSLSTPYDLGAVVNDNVTYDAISTVSGQAYGLNFNSDGTKMYMMSKTSQFVYQFDLSVGFDLTTVVYNAISFFVGPWTAQPTAFHMNFDGTKMYVFGDDTNTIYEYTFGTPYDMSTVTYSNNSLAIGGVIAASEGLILNTDGTKMYVNWDRKIYQYTLSTAWDVSSGTYDSLVFATNDIAETFEFGDFVVSPDGTKLYGVDSEFGTTGTVFQLNTNI